MEISRKLQRFCYDCIYKLANAFNSTLSAGMEYEIGFNEVMDVLGVPESKREDILNKVFYFSETAGFSYHELSPLNQFIVTIPPYVFYCLENKLPNDKELKEESIALINDGVFAQYLQKQLGMKISQEIKGALWRPGARWLSATGAKILTCFFILLLAGFLFFVRESTPSRIISYIAGILLVIVWISNLFIGREYTYIAGSVHSFTVWQWNIIPLLTAICLLLTANIMFIPLGILFWYLPRLLVRLSLYNVGHLFPYAVSLAYGYNIGVEVGKFLNLTFPYWRLVLGVVGIIVIQVFCSLIVDYITGLYDHKSES